MRDTDPNDNTRSCFRTQDRVFLTNDEWFFSTREGEIGPFSSRDAALEEVKRYVKERKDLSRFQEARGGGLSARTFGTVKEGLEDLFLDNQR